ncbi:MAG: DNA topology modulation protein FlaR [Solirubrobacterales bacterium]|nr:DNA topology modulation protein FlaR [Solirubrobacterales bacterium]
MERIAVIGCSGNGKSTFATRLGDRLDIPVIHLDARYWQPGWVQMPRPQWRELQYELVAGDRWIIDGNYGATLDIRLAAADTVVLFDLPARVCLLGVVRRWARNRGVAVQAPGCPERWSWELLRWVWRWRRDSRPRALDAIGSHAQHARVVVVSTRADADALIARSTDPALRTK